MLKCFSLVFCLGIACFAGADEIQEAPTKFDTSSSKTKNTDVAKHKDHKSKWKSPRKVSPKVSDKPAKASDAPAPSLDQQIKDADQSDLEE